MNLNQQDKLRFAGSSELLKDQMGGFLQDSTGIRRYFPMLLGSILTSSEQL